ncbi:putative methyltransferase DDB_G0268948 isoform X2 [Antedon mediterranea]|uniref:putative methyltransferase DDB_G0268948 isoform X2 n=1 Tax=Antedon mediterranea TaxID=105859 RepID=UPI003AF47B72
MRLYLGKLLRKVTNKHLFANQGHAELYLKYRPTYPDSLISRIIEYLHQGRVDNKPDGLAVDVGCGSGQFTRSLGQHFDRVIGVDVSESQLASARLVPRSNIEYLSGSGESIPVSNGSTDLITCAMCIHWLDFPKFCDEVQRVLKPNGCIAAFGYEMQCCRVNGKKVEKIEEAYNKLIQEKTKPYWTPNRKHVFNGYADIQLPFENNKSRCHSTKVTSKTTQKNKRLLFCSNKES